VFFLTPARSVDVGCLQQLFFECNDLATRNASPFLSIPRRYLANTIVYYLSSTRLQDLTMLRGRRFSTPLVAILLLVAVWFIALFPWNQLADAAVPSFMNKAHSHSSTSSTQNVAVIIENRPLSNLAPLILHFSSVLGPAWPVILYTSGNSLLNASIPFQRAIDEKRVQIRHLPNNTQFENHAAVSEFLTRPWFWEQLAPAGHVLMFQADSILCSNSDTPIEHFLQYDFIGAPIGPGHGQGFNGGLSLRNRSMILDITRRFSWAGEREQMKFSSLEACVTNWPCLKFEDQWFYHKMKEIGMKASLPSKEVAMKFSVETIWAERPLGYHQVDRWSAEHMDEVAAWCPEYTMVTTDLFVYHNPPPQEG